jgi:lipoprotein-anchoring transpeptidase ErfK/SrfK
MPYPSRAAVILFPLALGIAGAGVAACGVDAPPSRAPSAARADRPSGSTVTSVSASASATESNAASPSPPSPSASPPSSDTNSAVAAPTPTLSTKSFQSFIWEHARYDKNGMIGFFRAGARVARSAEPYDGKDAVPCGGKWYKLEPAGFVCEGKDGVTLDPNDPIVVAAAKYPPKAEPLPYGYGMSHGSVMYARVPTRDDQKAAEGDVAAWRKTMADVRAKTPPDKLWPETALPIGDMPSFLENHAQAPPLLPGLASNKAARGGYAMPSTRLAFVSAFESEGRPFYLTTEHLVVPADRIRAATLSDFHGVELAPAGQAGEHLPMAWVRFPSDKMPARVYKLEGGVLTMTDVVLAYQAHVAIAETDVTVKGAKYHELTARPASLASDAGGASVTYVVKSTEVTRLDAAKALPEKVGADEVWIDVSIYKQTLVAYRGLVPTFATLISSGSGGKTHSTPFGAFRVYQKHISSRMSAEEKPEKPATEDGAVAEEAEHAYRYDEVPYVQYVVGGIALHAAFWHEGFGLPRSHGCINLAPRDAQTVFQKTLPALPAGWHGIAPGRAGMPLGTMVVIRG